MTRAEEVRDQKIAAMSDFELLCVLTATPRDEAIALTEYKAFQDMRRLVEEGMRLNKKQRTWGEDAARRILPIDASLVPRGSPVPTPPVLQNLPKRPPRRPRDEDDD